MVRRVLRTIQDDCCDLRERNPRICIYLRRIDYAIWCTAHSSLPSTSEAWFKQCRCKRTAQPLRWHWEKACEASSGQVEKSIRYVLQHAMSSTFRIEDIPVPRTCAGALRANQGRASATPRDVSIPAKAKQFHAFLARGHRQKYPSSSKLWL
ncbi:hypothetical protein BJX66DRAFT_49133 [Aspergillus keveii]|uniref:Uncharacterized protein n=1 Tax=Aspergillus keveii TaxID=714993 RepID=A0ABR4FRJ7_9EURO